MIKELFETCRLLVGGYYPAFVTGNQIRLKLPVFYFHHIDPGLFEKQLSYLKQNMYNTLNINELDSYVNDDDHGRSNSVVLTIDDGYADLYDVAYPLLSDYGFKAVAFVSPFWLDKPGYITWEQAIEMEQSGHVDIQSHSYSHLNIPCSSEVIDYFHPGISDEAIKEIPNIDIKTGRFKEEMPAWGTPVYTFASGLTDEKCWLSSRDLEMKCQNYVNDHGGIAFFKSRKWKTQLDQITKDYYQQCPEAGVFETDEMQHQRIFDEVYRSRIVLQEKLNKSAVNAFAFPRHAMGKIVLSQLEKAGFHYVFGGLIPLCKITQKQYLFNFFNRVNEDFLFRLPGNNRDKFWEPFLKKATIN